MLSINAGVEVILCVFNSFWPNLLFNGAFGKATRNAIPEQ